MSKRWEFLYWDNDKRLDRADPTAIDGLLRTRSYSGSLIEACDKMLAFANGRHYEVAIDYEVRDLQHKGRGHDCVNLRSIDHPISELIW